MTSVAPAAGRVHVGMDVSRDTIAVAVLQPWESVPAVELIGNDGEAVRRLAGTFADRSVLAACYEAGPGGYQLHRLLASLGVACDVIAPALIPRGAADRVKTDRRDCVRLALSHRAGLLTAVRVPSEQEEAVRDLVRTRADLADDRKRMMQRINALLQRHGRIWRAPRWTGEHRAWLDRQSFDEPALEAALRTYLAALDARDAELAVLERQLRGCWAGLDPLAPMVRQLGCYRGIAELTALTLAAEVADFRRFASAPAFMGFTGLTPSEYSSGARTRRGSITKAGSRLVRTALVEAAWAYRHRPAIGVRLRQRQADADPATLARSWAAQQRLHATYAKLTRRGKIPAVAITATARELAGFVWAEMTS
jgi:transposase